MRTHAGMFDVSHMGEVEVEGPGALAFLQLVLTNDVAKIEIGGAQYSCLCDESGGVLDDLFAYRLGGDRYLIVTNSANHETDLAWLGRWSRDFDVDRPRRRRPLRDARRPGPARPGDRRRGRSESSCPPRMRVAAVRIGGRPALACGTGYTGEDGVELLIDPEVAPAIWAELLDAGVVPCGLGARDTLRLEVCFHLHGNDLSPGAQPDRSRPRLVLRGADRLRRLGRGRPGPRRGPGAEAGAVQDRGRRDPAPGQPGPRRRRGGRRRHLGHLLALAGDRDRDGLPAARPGRARHRGRDRRARQATPRPDSFQAPLRDPSKEKHLERRGQLPRRAALPRRARLGPDRGRRACHLRDHLVRPGQPRRGRLLRPARGRRDDRQGRQPTPRSSR